MLEQDFIMRMIYQMVRMILKILFDIETDTTIENIELEDENILNLRQALLSMARNGQINEAEDLLFESLERKNPENFKVAKLFYQFINEFPDEILEKNDFFREEIRQGVEDIMRAYGQGEWIGFFNRQV